MDVLSPAKAASPPSTPVRARSTLSPATPPTPIPQLAPDLPDLASVVGTVSLLWPYSIATGTPTLKLKLADTDPLKRFSKGRVLITFVQRLAQRLKEANVNIGDELHINLSGAEWEVEKSVDKQDVGWAIVVGKKGGTVEVSRNGEFVASIEVSEAEAEVQSKSYIMAYTPGRELVTVPEPPKTPDSPSARLGASRRTSSGPIRHVGGDMKAGLLTKFSEYVPISQIRFNATLDLVGIVTRQKPPAQAKAGARDWILNFRIVDPSSLKGLSIVIGRPNKRALPDLSSPGDDSDDECVSAILLRNFRIETFKRNFVAVAGRTSSWVVWKGLDKEKYEGKKVKPVVSGPPVEFGSEEEEYAAALGRWFWKLSSATRKELRKVRHWEG